MSRKISRIFQINKLAYKNDVKYTVKLSRILALILGLWPINFDDSFWKKIVKFTLNVIACFLMFCSILSNVLTITYEMKSVHEKVELVGPTNFYIMSLSKYLILLYRGETVKKCFKHIEEDWKFCSIRENYREIMLKNAHYGRYLIILCAIFMYCGGFGYHLIRPLVSEKIITAENVTVIPYPAPVYGKFLNTGYSPHYEIIFIMLLVADFVLFSATVVPFSFASVLTLHACGQLEIVTIYLNDLVSETRKETNFAHERLIIIINSHLRVLSFVSQLEHLLNEICLIEVVGCSLNMCLVGSYIIESWKKDDLTAAVSYAVILLSFTFNIFIYCYLGELLTTQATKLGEKGYMIEWHRLPRKISLDLLLFIRVCQFPAKITAGKVVTLSMATFSKVIKSSAAYFNALWKLYQ